MSRRGGEVWFGRQRVGMLHEEPPGELHFSYDHEWLEAGRFPVSISLPLDQGERPVEATGYFEGLLPEGLVRQRICRRLGIAPDDHFGLLLAIGGDCAGALSILPVGTEPRDDADTPQELNQDALLALARSGGRDTATLTESPQRFSLAGAQEKQPVIIEGERYFLSGRSHPSSHILKFETVARVCLAECLANRVAIAIDLPVVDTGLIHLDGETPLLRIRRFDRTRDEGGNIKRLHQEDLLQAAGLPSMLKYQREGGPSLADVAGLIRQHTASPATAITRLRDWQMFNCLIGNWDGHAKNLAICYPDDEPIPELAPFYDLVAIKFLNQLSPGTWSRDMAMAIGGAYTPERIGREQWETFARDLGIPLRPTISRLQQLAERLPEIARHAAGEFAAGHGYENIVEYFTSAVEKRCQWVLQTTVGI